MRILTAIGWTLVTASAFGATIALLRLPADEILCGRGRHVSRYLIRIMGRPRARALRCCLAAMLASGWVVTYPRPLFVPAAVFFNVWLIDDWLFRDRDRKHKHEWAKVRLRMPKPVKLRPVEKWNPVPV